jgi:hypothetical protein
MKMSNRKKSTKDLINIDELDQNFQRRGVLPANRDVGRNLRVLENLGFTSSINSVVNELEQTGKIRVLSPFSQSQTLSERELPSKFGAISNANITSASLDPAVKRVKFVNTLLMRILIVAIIINFILIFAL